MKNFQKTTIALALLCLGSAVCASGESLANNALQSAAGSALADGEGLYQITINREFKTLAPVVKDGALLYIPMSYLPPSMVSRYNLAPYIKKRGEPLEDMLEVDASFLHNLNEQDMTMDLVLGRNYFSDHTVVKRLNYVDRNAARFDGIERLAYLSNNYQAYINERGDFSGTLNSYYSSPNYWSVRNRMLYSGDKLLRLGTVYKKEFTDKSALQIGDITEDTGRHLPSLNGIGVKYATNYFNNRTNLSVWDALPQYSVSGFSLTPSIFNLEANSSRVVSSELGSGNYEIVLPFNQGYGLYDGYVRDYLGNVQQFSIPMYGSADVLRAGQLEYSVSAAHMRRDMFRSSFQYGKPYVSGILKYGVIEGWTQDFSFHTSAYSKSIYTAANFIVKPQWGLFKLGVNYNEQSQKLFTASWERQARKGINARASYSTSGDRQGYCIYYLDSCLRMQAQASLGYGLPAGLGSVSLRHTREVYDNFFSKTNSLYWSRSIGRQMSVSVILDDMRSSNMGAIKRIYATLNYQLGSGYSGSSNYSHSSGAFGNQSGAQTSLYKREDSAHPEYGYGRFTLGNNTQGGRLYNINYGANLSRFSYDIQANGTRDYDSLRAGIRGNVLYIPSEASVEFIKNTSGIIVVDTGAPTSGSVSESSAGEEKSTQPLEIYHQNKLAGFTNDKGRYIISRAVPYNTEKVEINLKSLPLDKNFATFKQSVIVPEYGAAKIYFKPMQPDKLISIDNLPSSSIFTIEGSSFVVDENGQASVDKLGKAIYSNGRQQCSFEITLDKDSYSCK